MEFRRLVTSFCFVLFFVPSWCDPEMDIPCSGYEKCGPCTENLNCGWCDADKTCRTGTIEGPSYVSCDRWAYSYCSSGSPCSTRPDCNACVNANGCAWCSSSGLAGECKDVTASCPRFTTTAGACSAEEMETYLDQLDSNGGKKSNTVGANADDYEHPLKPRDTKYHLRLQK